MIDRGATSGGPPQAERHLCQVCKAVYKTYDALIHHKVSARRHYCCEFCHSDFKDEEAHRVHKVQLHPQEQSLPCQHCGKLFSRLGGLISHYELTECRGHSKEKFGEERKAKEDRATAMRAAHGFQDFTRSTSSSKEPHPFANAQPSPSFGPPATKFPDTRPGAIWSANYANAGRSSASPSAGQNVGGLASSGGGENNDLGGQHHVLPSIESPSTNTLYTKTNTPASIAAKHEDLINFEISSAILNKPWGKSSSVSKTGDFQALGQKYVDIKNSILDTPNVIGPAPVSTHLSTYGPGANDSDSRTISGTTSMAASNRRSIPLYASMSGSQSTGAWGAASSSARSGTVTTGFNRAPVAGSGYAADIAPASAWGAPAPAAASAANTAQLHAWGPLPGSAAPAASAAPVSQGNGWDTTIKLYPHVAPALQPPTDQMQSLAVSPSKDEANPFDPDNFNFKAGKYYVDLLGKYKCPHPRCGKSIQKVNAFLAHLRSPAHRAEKLQCSKCLRYFDTATALTQHSESQGTRCTIRDTDGYGNVIDVVTAGKAKTDGRLADNTVRYAVNPLDNSASAPAPFGAQDIIAAHRAGLERHNQNIDKYWTRNNPKW